VLDGAIEDGSTGSRVDVGLAIVVVGTGFSPVSMDV